MLRVPFSLEDIKNILRKWVNNDKSIKLEEFKKIFRDNNNNSMIKSMTKFEGKNTNKLLTEMLKELRQNVDYNLVNFFRKYDSR